MLLSPFAFGLHPLGLLPRSEKVCLHAPSAWLPRGAVALSAPGLRRCNARKRPFAETRGLPGLVHDEHQYLGAAGPCGLNPHRVRDLGLPRGFVQAGSICNPAGRRWPPRGCEVQTSDRPLRLIRQRPLQGVKRAPLCLRRHRGNKALGFSGLDVSFSRRRARLFFGLGGERRDRTKCGIRPLDRPGYAVPRFTIAGSIR